MGMAEMILRGRQARAQQEQERMQQAIQQTQLQQIMTDRALERRRTSPDYGTRLMRIQDPETPTDEVGRLMAGLHPADLEDVLSNRQANITHQETVRAQFATESEIMQAMQLLGEEAGGWGGPPQEMPAIPKGGMRRDLFEKVITAKGQAAGREAVQGRFETSQDLRERQQAETERTHRATEANRSRIATLREDTSRATLGLRQATLANRAKMTESQIKVNESRIKAYESSLALGHVDLNDIVWHFKTTLGGDKPSDEQNYLAITAANEAFADILENDTPAPIAIQRAMESNGIKPGAEEAPAVKPAPMAATKPAPAGAKTAAPVERIRSVMQKLGETETIDTADILRRAGLEATPENAALVDRVFSELYPE